MDVLNGFAEWISSVSVLLGSAAQFLFCAFEDTDIRRGAEGLRSPRLPRLFAYFVCSAALSAPEKKVHDCRIHR